MDAKQQNYLHQEKRFEQKFTNKIKTDVVSVRANLMKEIEPPAYVKFSKIGIKKNSKPVQKLTYFTLQRINELSKTIEPQGEKLKYVLDFINKCRRAKQNIRNKMGDDSTAID